MRKVLLRSYIILLELLGCCIVIYVHCLNNTCYQWLKDLSLSFLTNLSTVILVAILVDYITHIYQAKEKQRLTKIAFRKIKLTLKEHFELLFKMFKASTQDRPNKKYVNIEDLFDQQYYLEIGLLDLSKDAPVYTPYGKIDWLDYISSECLKYQNCLNQNLDRYSFIVSLETIDLLEKNIDSGFIKLMQNLQIAKSIPYGQMGTIPIGNFFKQPGIQEVINDHVNSFLNLVDYYNRNVSKKQMIKIDESEWEQLWDNHYSPSIGNSRV